MTATQLLEEATPVEWYDRRIMGDRFIVDWPRLIYWVSHHFNIKTAEDAVKRLTSVDEIAERITIDGKDYLIPGCCYKKVLFT